MVFIQSGNRYRSMTEKEKNHLIANITESMMFLPEERQKKIVTYLKKADIELGESVERGL